MNLNYLSDESFRAIDYHRGGWISRKIITLSLSLQSGFFLGVLATIFFTESKLRKQTKCVITVLKRIVHKTPMNVGSPYLSAGLCRNDS